MVQRQDAYSTLLAKGDRASPRESRRDLWLGVASLAVLTLVASLRVYLASGVFCQTYDEPFHMARGMRWMQEGSYPYVHHPPLAPVLFAALPTLTGVRYEDHGDKLSDGNAVLYQRGEYSRILLLARLGNSPFFVAGCVAVWLWARRFFSIPGAVLVVAVFTSMPPVLAHAGLATTDMAVTCLLTWWLWLWDRWLSKPELSYAMALGITGGLLLVSKFSAIVFTPLCALVVLVWRRLPTPDGDGSPEKRHARFVRGIDLLMCGLIMFFCVWATYRFSIGSVAEVGLRADRDLRFPLVSEAWSARLKRIPTPAPEFIAGILSVLHQNEHGQAPYFLGQPGDARGDWRFFPILLATKTPLGFLILAAIGAYRPFAELRRRSTDKKQRSGRLNSSQVVSSAFLPFQFAVRDSQVAIGNMKKATSGPVLALCLLLTILAPAMASDINLGLRHVLPLYPWLAMLTACGFFWLWRGGRRKTLSRCAAAALITWGSVSGIAAHPDYLSYFNALALGRAEIITVDSDLDWGQDLLRLRRELKRRRIEHVYLSYFGTADPSRHALPSYTVLHPLKRPRGWIAISVHHRKVNPGYAWLESLEPVATVGDSIRLYHVKTTDGLGN